MAEHYSSSDSNFTYVHVDVTKLQQEGKDFRTVPYIKYTRNTAILTIVQKQEDFVLVYSDVQLVKEPASPTDNVHT